MPSHRIDRLSMDVKRELADIFSGMKDPRISEMLSVMRVEVTSDLSYAKVYVGSLEGTQRAKEAVEALKKAQGHVRSELGSRLHIRKVPEITFIADDSADYYEKISSIIEGFHNEHTD
ncbi:MAG: 30S ribosome-binding factor RbfA [Oscillospiraceae bacterium]